MKLSSDILQKYLNLLKSKGEHGLYRYSVGHGIIRSVKDEHPEIEMLHLSEAFFSSFRSTGNENFFIVAKALRRAANKLYRHFLKMNHGREMDRRFLNLL